MTQNDLKFYVPGIKINLVGYTSTSKGFDRALKFALSSNNQKEDLIPVVFEINFYGQQGLFEMTKGYTAFPNEREVLIQDGLEYSISQNIEASMQYDKTQINYHLIKLHYPAKEAS